MQHALVDVIRMALGLWHLEDSAVHRDPQFLGPPDLRKGVVQGWPLPYVPKRLCVVHGDDAPHERLVPVPGLGSVQVRADEGADEISRGLQQPVRHEARQHGITVAGEKVTMTSCQHRRLPIFCPCPPNCAVSAAAAQRPAVACQCSASAPHELPLRSALSMSKDFTERRHRICSRRYRSISTGTSRPCNPTPTVITPAGVVATARTIPMKFVNGPSRIRTAWPTMNSAGAIRPPPPSRCAFRSIHCTPNSIWAAFIGQAPYSRVMRIDADFVNSHSPVKTDEGFTRR